MYDQRLFNQGTGGVGSGLAGEDDDYNLYDKPLFADRTAATIYKNTKNIDVDKYVGDEDAAKTRVRKVLGAAEGQGQGAGFDGKASGAEGASAAARTGRNRPVEFEKTRLQTAEDDANFRPGLQKRQKTDE